MLNCPFWSADLGYAVNRIVHSVHDGASGTLAPMDDFHTWADVAEAIEQAPEGTQAALGRWLPMDQSQLSRTLKRAAGNLTVQQAAKIKAFFEAEEAPLSTIANETGRRAQFKQTQSGLIRRLPVFGYAAASDGERFVLNEGQILEERELPMGIALPPGDYFIVLPVGSSMEPRIMEGEAQVVRRDYPPGRDKDAVIEFLDGTAVIKSYRGRRDGRVWADQYNPPKTLDYDATTVKGVHAVIFSF